MTRRPRLRRREIVLAVTIGALAAGGAAWVYDGADQPRRPAVSAANLLPASPPPFDGITTIGPQDVIVTAGETHAISIDGDAAERVVLSVEDGVLTIRPNERARGGWARRFTWGGRPLKIHVTVPALRSVALIGSGDLSVDEVSGPRFTASVTGPGELLIENLAVDEADLSLSGPGDLVAAGIAGHVRLTLAGSGDIKADDLSARSAAITLRGSGDAELSVSEEAQISIVGSGDVEIAGPARCQVSRFGQGEARCDGD